MDLGLYNKKTEPRGEHGTLIGNWVEERALAQATGHARYEDLSIEKKALNMTQDRIICHRDPQDAASGAPQRISTMKATFINHGTDSFTPKIFNQTGSHWQNDEGQVTLTAKRRDMQSHISFGTMPVTYASTSGSSFLHSTLLTKTEQVPLKLQQTTKAGVRHFPDTNAISGGLQTSKLDRPYIIEHDAQSTGNPLAAAL